MIPLLTLGLPGSGATAVILAAFLLHGVQPGPMMFESPASTLMVYTILASMFASVIGMCLLGVLGLVRAFTATFYGIWNYLFRPFLLIVLLTASLVSLIANVTWNLRGEEIAVRRAIGDDRFAARGEELEALDDRAERAVARGILAVHVGRDRAADGRGRMTRRDRQIPAAREREALHVADARASLDADSALMLVESKNTAERRERLAHGIGAEARGDVRDAGAARDARHVLRQRFEQTVAIRPLHAAARAELAIEARKIDVGEREASHVGAARGLQADSSSSSSSLPSPVSTSNRRCRSRLASFVVCRSAVSSS